MGDTYQTAYMFDDLYCSLYDDDDYIDDFDDDHNENNDVRFYTFLHSTTNKSPDNADNNS